MCLLRLFRQTGTLARKDLQIVVWHQWLSTFLRAVALPLAYIFFIAYCRNFFLPPSHYGIGSSNVNAIRNITTEVFGSSTHLGGRNRVVFVDNGFAGGPIDTLIQSLANPLTEAGADVRIVPSEDELFDLCQSSLRGISECYGAATFRSSPSEGTGSWSYTARADFGLGLSPYVNQADNDVQIFVLPFINAIDAGIARIEGVEFPERMLEYPFTYETRQDRADDISDFFMGALNNYLAVAMFIAICGITYHLPGHLATERELGISSLIDAMLYARHRIYALLARLISIYLSMAAVYIPSWIGIGVIVSTLMFTETSSSIIIPFHLLTGLSLTGYSILFASFFRKAQLSGTTTLLFALVIGIVSQFVPRTITAIAVLSCLFPPAAYTFFQIQLSAWERSHRAANLNTSPSGLDAHELRGYYFFVFVVIQIVVYPLLAVAVQWTLYGTASRSRRQLPPNSCSSALVLSNVSKFFYPSWWRRAVQWNAKPFKAVDDLSISIEKGHIVALLGANGSGKSTTLAAISGTQAVSRGHIEMDLAAGLGFCPQHNTLWDDLSVIDHISIFDSLKAQGATASKQDFLSLATACGLSQKATKKSKTLSGGQKRKLQLAMAFAGDSQLCCIDEVSSGLDPMSRRVIWQILLSERGRRTLLLTTHALDEADALADDIAIMSKGRLAVKGSAPELKDRFGGGYTISSSDKKAEHLEGTTPLRDNTDETNFRASTSAEACEIASKLKVAGVNDTQISGPTIEGVFQVVAKEFAEEIIEIPDGVDVGQNTSPSIPATRIATEPSRLSDQSSNSVSSASGKASLGIVSGKPTSLLQQTWILYRKRLLIFTRNWLPYLCATVIPIITSGLTTMFLAGFDRQLCARGTATNNPQRLTLPALEVYWGVLVPVGPAEEFAPSELPASYQPFTDRIELKESYQEFNNYIADNFRDVVPGGFYLDPDTSVGSAPLMAYRINGNIGYSALMKNVIDSYLMNTTINADFSTFALPFTGSTGDSLQLVLYITFAMCAFTGFFALYPTFERNSNIRALHYSNGIRPAPLWLAYWLFDAVFVIIVAVVSISVLGSLSDVWFAPSYLCIVFFLFGLSSIFLAYIVSLFCTSQLAAFAFLAGGQAIGALVYFLLYLVILTFAAASSLQDNLNILQYTWGLVTPSGNVLRALLLALNQSQVLCRDRSYISYPGDISAYGCPILYLIIQIIGFYGFLAWHDSGRRLNLARFWRKRESVIDTEKEAFAVPQDVRDETSRTESSKDQLQILHLQKKFGRDKVVDDVTLGVNGSQVLALLGPNGAGKTTTLSMIRGDIQPSSQSAEVLVSGISIRKDRLAARQRLGVCPQFNTMDYMTVFEHLSFYARVRGVPKVKHNVVNVIETVGLSAYKGRLAGKLSGGNQRKLSLATAIIGNPTVLLLDEPSTGMDAVAMRVMWKAIRAVGTDRAIAITTHSMEEASTLSDKTAILDRRLLAVSATKDVVKKFGQGYHHVHLVLASGASASPQEMQRVRDWINETMLGALAHDESGSARRGQLRFKVPIRAPPTTNEGKATYPEEEGGVIRESPVSGTHVVDLMNALEDQKQRLGISYFSVSRATLEDVFLEVISSDRSA